MKSESRDPRQRPWAGIGVALGLVFAAVLLWTVIGGPGGRVRDGRLFLADGLSVPVLGRMVPLQADRGQIEVWESRPATTLPAFDVPGLEQPLSPRPPFWEPHTWPGATPIVHLGEVAAQTAYIHAAPRPGLWASLKAIFGGEQAPAGLCFTSGFASSHCAYETSGSLPTFNAISGSRFFTWWIGVPAGTAVVIAGNDPMTTRWQRPVAESVVFTIEDATGAFGAEGITLIALDADGNQLERLTVSPFEDEFAGP